MYIYIYIYICGPTKVVSCEPMRMLCKAQLKRCLDGFDAEWPLEKCTVRYRNRDVVLQPGTFTMRAAIAKGVADTPAAAVMNGHMGHTSLLACRIGGTICKGKKSRGQDGIIKKGKAQRGGESDRLHWDPESVEQLRAQAAALQPPALALAAFEGIASAPNKTRVTKIQTDSGWKERTLHADFQDMFPHCLSRDQVLDGMHLLMVVIKDKAYSSWDVIKLTGELIYIYNIYIAI